MTEEQIGELRKSVTKAFLQKLRQAGRELPRNFDDYEEDLVGVDGKTLKQVLQEALQKAIDAEKP